jgi:hypothetical protein
MDLKILTNVLGWLALFPLAMLLMTEGLNVFDGGGLKHLLAPGRQRRARSEPSKRP